MTQEGEETSAGAGVDGPAGGGGQQSPGSEKEEEEDCTLCTPGAHTARGAARPAWQPPERGRQSRAAQLRSGPGGPARGEPTGREQRQEPDAEGRDSSIRARGPVVTAGRDDPGDGGARRWEVCALGRRSGGGGSWIHLPGMHPWQSLSRKGVGSSVLAAQSSVPGERRERERKSPKSRRSAPPSLLGAPAPLSLASRRML